MAQVYLFPISYVHKVNITLIKGEQINTHGFMLFIALYYLLHYFLSIYCIVHVIYCLAWKLSSFLSTIHFCTILHLNNFS